MGTPSSINDLASIIALAASVPALCALLLYGLGSPWWRSWLGVVMFCQWSGIVLVFAVILGRRFYGEYSGYEWVAVASYSILLVTYWALVLVILLERRPAKPLLITIQRENRETP